jgi:hypothetical protein
MFLALARRLAPAAVSILLSGAVACGSDESSPPADGLNDARIAFDDGPTLTARPGENREIGITVAGEDTDVSLSLDGNYLGASLSANQVTTHDHHASVTLQLPLVGATFAVRARLKDQSSAHLDVVVSLDGASTLRITPVYEGKRAAPEVFTSLFLRTSCAALQRNPWPSSAPTERGLVGQVVKFTDVPANSPLAILSRIKGYAEGCMDIAGLVPDHTLDVSVRLDDKPIALGLTDLETSFSFDLDTSQQLLWDDMMNTAVAQATDSFMASGGMEGQKLLDEMRTLVPLGDQVQFDAFRKQKGWNATSEEWITTHTPGLRSMVASWLKQGRPTSVGSLLAHMSPTDSPKLASVKWRAMGTFAASDLALVPQSQFAWDSTEPGSVFLSGVVDVSPSRLVTAGANNSASGTSPGVTDVPSAIATALDCAGLASAIVGDLGVSYPSCDDSCTAKLCRSAIDAMWLRARDSGKLVSISIASTAEARVGDNAEPVWFSGGWVGSVGTVPPFSVQGTASGYHKDVP